MQKISGILKPSTRVTGVDLKESAPVRPGAPTFGRAEGVSSLRDRGASVNGLEAGMKAHDTMMHWRTKEGQNTRAAEAIADRFFAANQQEAPKSITKFAPAVPEIGEADVDREPAYDEMPVNPLHEEPIPGELYPKGSFLNVAA